MIIFGGSPINVAVPPILEAKTSVIKNGTGSVSNSFAITKVIGIIKTTVVTLSKNADAIAVNAASANKTVFGCPLVSFNKLIANHLNTPLRLAIFTIIIIPISKNITSKSTYSKTPFTLCSKFNERGINPSNIVKEAPTNATTDFWIFSLAMKM